MRLETDMVSSEWLADEFWQTLLSDRHQEIGEKKKLQPVEMGCISKTGDSRDIWDWLRHIEESRNIVRVVAEAKKVTGDADLFKTLSDKIQKELAFQNQTFEKLALRIRIFYAEQAAESVLTQYRAHIKAEEEKGRRGRNDC